jgi:hypothetical protein
MAIEYDNFYHSKGLKKLPKLGFLVWKQTIWQPCDAVKERWWGQLNFTIFCIWSISSFCIHSSVCLQGCQILRGTMYQNYDNIPHDHKIYQHVIKYTKWLENGPNGHPYNSIFHCKALRNLPKLGFLVWKYTYHLATPFVCSLLPFAGIRDALKTLFIIAGSDLLN